MRWYTAHLSSNLSLFCLALNVEAPPSLPCFGDDIIMEPSLVNTGLEMTRDPCEYSESDDDADADADSEISGNHSHYSIIIAFDNITLHNIYVLESEEIWNDSDSESDSNNCSDGNCPVSDAPSVPNFDGNSTQYHHSTILSQWLIGFLITLQMKFYFPDNALTLLLKFLSAFFTVLGNFSPLMDILSRTFPSSLHSLRKKISLEDSYAKYIVCPKCEQTYQYADCIDVVGSLRLSKRCTHVKFPNHPHMQKRNPCGTLLLKTVELKSGKELLYPFKLYSYKSVKDSLQCLLLRSGFYENCQLWRNSTNHSDIRPFN